MSVKWVRSGPKAKFNELTSAFGEPSVFDPDRDGLALWLRKDLKSVQLYGRECCFDEILIRDESVRHRCPKSHTDFLYTYIKVDIHPDVLPLVQSVSGSVHYDPLKKLLCARCGSMEANIATLKLVTDILTDKVNRSLYMGGLSKLYGDTISSTNDQSNVEEYYHNICDNLLELGSPSSQDYWPGAFNPQCGDPEVNWDAVCGKANKIRNQSAGNGNGNDNKANKPNQSGGYGSKENKSDWW